MERTVCPLAANPIRHTAIMNPTASFPRSLLGVIKLLKTCLAEESDKGEGDLLRSLRGLPWGLADSRSLGIVSAYRAIDLLLWLLMYRY